MSRTKQPAAKKRRSTEMRTRWPCVVVRHREGCPAVDGKRCRCKPSYRARVWDPTRRRPIPSPAFESPAEGISWQQDMRAALQAASEPSSASPTLGFSAPELPALAQAATRIAAPTIDEVSTRFILAIGEGTALNKHGRRYTPKSRRTVEEALRGRINEELGSVAVDELRRGQIQTLVDEMVAEALSGSRVRNVVNALRSLYAYAIPRDLADSSPIENILLPARDEKPRDRIATPREFVQLLDALEPADAVPFAIAAYATARSQEILNLIWDAVEFNSGMLYLAEEEEYAKTKAAKRPFPMPVQLKQILDGEWQRQGHPSGTALICPGRKPGGRNSGLLSTSALYTRADKAWEARKLQPIRLQDCRHTASSWLRAAGIDLKLRSVLMGHATTASTDRGPGSITNDRYTHILPGEIERAGERFEKYLTTQATTNATPTHAADDVGVARRASASPGASGRLPSHSA